MMNPITSLSPNEIFKGGDGKTFLIIQQIGQGKTGSVYHVIYEKKERPVALKVMRDELSEDMQRRFKSEAVNLHQISDLVRLSKIGVRLVPEMVANSDDEPVYIAQELIRGVQLIDLLEGSNTVEEEIGVIVCWRFAQLLEVLHEQYMKTYADMKFENIWWIKDENNIRVTDWNVVAEANPEGIKHDLLRFGCYAARVLAGSMPVIRGDVILENILDKPGFEQISYGMQQFLRKALHINPAYRYKSASEMVTDLEEIAAYWQLDRLDIKQVLNEALEKGGYAGNSSKESYAYFRKARIIFDVIQSRYRLQPAESEEYQKRIRKSLDESDALTIGREFYDATDYNRALSSFETGYKEGRGNLTTHLRWLELTRAAIHFGDRFASYNKIFQLAIDSLIAGKYNQALKGFEAGLMVDVEFQTAVIAIKNSETPNEVQRNYLVAERLSPELSLLYVEILAWFLYNQASEARKQENYKDAERLYLFSQTLFDLLPEERKVFVPDISRMADEVNRLQRIVHGVADTIKKAEQDVINGKISSALLNYEDVYQIIVDVTDPNKGIPSLPPQALELSQLWASIDEKAIGMLKSSKFEDAGKLFELGLKYYPGNEKFLVGKWQAEQLAALFHQDVLNDPKRATFILLRILLHIDQLEKYPILRNELKNRVPDVFSRVINLREFELARRLLDAAILVDDTQLGKELSSQYNSIIKREHEEISSRIINLLSQLRRKIDVQASQIEFRTDLGSEQEQIEEQLEIARQLALSSPALIGRQSLSDQVFELEKYYIKKLRNHRDRKSKNSISSELLNNKASAETTYQYAISLRRLFEERIKQLMQSVELGYSVEWFRDMKDLQTLIEEIKTKLQQANTLTDKTLLNLTPEQPLYQETNSLKKDIVSSLKTFDEQIEEKWKIEKQKIERIHATARQAISNKNFYEASGILDGIKMLVPVHPEFIPEYEKLKGAAEKGRLKKFLPIPIFWVAISILSILALCTLGIATIALQRTGMFATPLPIVATTPPLVATTPPVVATTPPVVATTPIPTPTNTATVTPLPLACTAADYPSALQLLGAIGGETTESGTVDTWKGTVRWYYKNTGGCAVSGFDIPLGTTVFYKTFTSSENILPKEMVLGYGEILVVEHTLNAKKLVSLTRKLTFNDVKGSSFTMDLPKITMPNKAGDFIKVDSPPYDESVGSAIAPTLSTCDATLYPSAISIVGPEVGQPQISDQQLIGDTMVSVNWTLKNNGGCTLVISDLKGLSEPRIGSADKIIIENNELLLKASVNIEAWLPGQEITIIHWVYYNNNFGMDLQRSLDIKIDGKLISSSLNLTPELVLLPNR